MSTRLEIREKFRSENPEITDRVITDTVLNQWMKTANKEIACFTRCIVSNQSETFNSVADTQYYDLESNIDNFFDIDDIPGGAVYYDNAPLKKSSPSEMNQKRRNWKTSDSGTPKFWWRRGKYLWFDVPALSVKQIAVDVVLTPDDFDSDEEMPFNELDHLQVYDDGINKYLQWRAKLKVGKPDEGNIAKKDYDSYLIWMKNMVASYKATTIQLRPKSYPTEQRW